MKKEKNIASQNNLAFVQTFLIIFKALLKIMKKEKNIASQNNLAFVQTFLIIFKALFHNYLFQIQKPEIENSKYQTRNLKPKKA